MRKSVSMWWAVLVGVALIAGGLVTCRQEAGKAINDASRWTDAQGRPLDWAGDGLKCPECGDVLLYQSGYEYRCRKCGLGIEARYDSVSGRITFDW